MKASGRKAVLPPELDICLTNVCNMRCRYCYWSPGARETPARLSFRQAALGLELYLRGRDGPIEKIAVAGGEPFLDFPLLERFIRHARREAGPGVELEVFTNGTMLTPARAEALLEHDTRIIVSLDGAPGANDLNRRFSARGRSSVSRAVCANLAGMDRRLLGQLRVSATFEPRTAASMAANAEFLLGLGFGEVLFDMDILRIWDRQGLAALRTGLTRMKKLCVSLGKAAPERYGKSPVSLDFLFSRDEKEAIQDLESFRELSLAPDGFFYPSGLISAQGPARSLYRLGSLEKGVDGRRVSAVLSEVKGYFAAADYDGYASCPVNLYFYSRVNGLAPARILENGERVYLASRDALQLVESARVASLLESSPDFGDFPHSPRFVPQRSPASARLDVSGSLGAPAAGLPREAVDALLYSVGTEKELVLAGAFSPGGFERAECLVIYCLLKAAALGKRIRVLLESRPGAVLRRDELDFMAEHGLFLLTGGRVRSPAGRACPGRAGFSGFHVRAAAGGRVA